MEWMILPYRRYAEFDGRSQRMEYWMFTLFYWIVLILCVGVILAGLPWNEMQQSANGQSPPPGPLFWFGLALLIAFMLGSFIPSIAVTVRRFHDQNLSGWLYLLNFIPYLGGFIVFVFMCIDGTRGPNQHGDDPKDPGMTHVFA